MFKKIKSHQNPITLRDSKNIQVEQGLSYTPAQMNALRQKGIPITNMLVNEDMFFDGTLSGDMSYDPVIARGVNEIDAWNMERQAKKNLINGHVRDSQIYK